MTPLSEKQIEIVRAMADYDMNISEIARQIYVARNDVEYHVAQIHKKTGLNPKRFYDLIKLVELYGGNA